MFHLPRNCAQEVLAFSDVIFLHGRLAFARHLPEVGANFVEHLLRHFLPPRPEGGRALVAIGEPFAGLKIWCSLVRILSALV